MNCIHDPNPTISTRNCDVDLLHPDPDTIRLDDIAHALSHINRYTGHTMRPISVAQHSILVLHLAVSDGVENAVTDAHLRRALLLHDAAEAYVSDLPRPLKRQLPSYSEFEAGMLQAIGLALHVPLFTGRPDDGEGKQWGAIRFYDNLALSLEVHTCFPQVVDRWANLPRPPWFLRDWFVDDLLEKDPAQVARDFMAHYWMTKR